MPTYSTDDLEENPQDRALRQAARQRASHLRALTEELAGYEAHAATARAATNAEAVAKWDSRAEQVREQIQLHTADAAAPQRRASRRTPNPDLAA